MEILKNLADPVFSQDLLSRKVSRGFLVKAGAISAMEIGYLLSGCTDQEALKKQAVDELLSMTASKNLEQAKRVTEAKLQAEITRIGLNQQENLVDVIAELGVWAYTHDQFAWTWWDRVGARKERSAMEKIAAESWNFWNKNLGSARKAIKTRKFEEFDLSTAETFHVEWAKQTLENNNLEQDKANPKESNLLESIISGEVFDKEPELVPIIFGAQIAVLANVDRYGLDYANTVMVATWVPDLAINLYLRYKQPFPPSDGLAPPGIGA